MEDRRATKIPAPPKALQELNSGVPERSSRKRKAGSPLKAAPEAKKQAGSAGPVNAPSGQAEESWEQVQEETGWSLVACLGHKLSFTKRQDPKAKSEALLAHVKRLRAAGWHLHTLTERYELDVEALKGAQEREEAARAAEGTQHAAALAGVQGSLEHAEAALAAESVTKAVMSSKVAQLEQELDARKGELEDSNTAISKLQGEHQQAREHLAASVAQVRSLSDLHQQAQKYNAQLQEYNGKLQQEISNASQGLMKLQAEKHAWAEEQATLRGKLTAADGQLQTLQDTSTVAEKGRQEHAEDAARLRLQLAQVVQARDTAATECAALRAELDRFRECTGKSVEALEQEKACRANLQSLNQAQTELNQGLAQEVEMLRQGKSLMESLAAQRGTEVASLQAQVAGLTSKLAAAESELQEGELLRRRLHNKLLELKGNIRVFCRVRPTLGNEGASSNASQLVQFPAQGDLIGRGIELHMPEDGKSQQPHKHEYAFDKVFAPAATQQEVFEEISQLVQSALDGYKVCIFAYGQTGSGKTHTMLGTEGDPGVIPRAMEQVFASSKALEAKGWTFEMRMGPPKQYKLQATAEHVLDSSMNALAARLAVQASMLEIYNEEYKDLLGKGPPAGRKHQVSHDDKGCTSVSFLEAVDVRCPGRVADLMARATRQRAVGATALNERSSRSHMAFMLTIAGANPATGQHVQGVLNLIDLAGSERLSRSQASGDRLKETQAINKSLSSLGDVIVALANKEAHVPYRNSKLTYLLQHCLGGDAKTLMFVNIAPVPEAVNESVCSLRFAAKVNACVVGTAKRNVAGT